MERARRTPGGGREPPARRGRSVQRPQPGDPDRAALSGRSSNGSWIDPLPAALRIRSPAAGEPGVLRRQLAVGTALAAGDIARVDEVAAKVFRLVGNHGDQLILKLELVRPAEETQDQFRGRHDYVTWLARQALEGVPDVAPLSAPELAVVTGLDANVVGQGAATLQGHINALPGTIVLFKMENVAMGRHLQARLEAIRAQLAYQKTRGKGMQAQAALSALVARPATLQGLGRMAVFDLVVNNPDRFKPEGVVNLTNVDFSLGGDVIALDNLDPHNRIDAVWQGGAALASRDAMESWANQVVDYLAEKISYLGDAGNELWPDFMTGMRAGIQQLQRLEGDLRDRVQAEPDHHRQMLGQRLLARIEALPE